jgi:capsular exopolysaccharide synthesis family protein
MSKIFDALQKGSTPDKPSREPAPDRPEREAEARSGREPAETAAPAVRREPAPPPPPETGEPEADYSDDAFTRKLANLQANLEQILADRGSKTVIFAASSPGEGASTVSARFAQLLAEDPRMRVAYLDADFRNEGSRALDTVSEAGLASLLRGQTTLERALRRTARGRLDVLPSEGVDPKAYQFCAEETLRPVLESLRGSYHYTILDAAPILTAPETAVAAALTDGLVLVVRAGRTKREIVKRSIEQLRKYDVRVLGVVMNRQRYVIPEFLYRRL